MADAARLHPRRAERAQRADGGDFTVEEYLALQRVVHRTAEAVREELGDERVYLLSLESNAGNVHWHVLPLSPGTPYERQQFAAIMLEAAVPLDIPQDEKAALAARIGRRMGG